MSIAKSLPEIHQGFMQDCPLCSCSNRIVMKGVHKLGDKIELHPDMGYSFCNCRSIFYTSRENLRDEIKPCPNSEGIISYPDPFFAWPDPYQFHYWDVRRYHILWDLSSFVEYLEESGYEVLEKRRDFDVHSSTPQHYHVKVKPCV